MKIQWLPFEVVNQQNQYPLQSCLHTFATLQTLARVFHNNPESHEFEPGLGKEFVWSGLDEFGQPLIFRSNQTWPKDRMMLTTLLPIGADGLFPWRRLEAFRWLPSNFFTKILWVGDLPFFGKGYAVLREELSGQPWTVYKTVSKQDAEELVSFLLSFGEASYQVFPIENQDQTYCLALQDEAGAFHFFGSCAASNGEAKAIQMAQKLAKRFLGREVFLFADRVGGVLLERFTVEETSNEATQPGR
jgi:hypothetical protein